MHDELAGRIKDYVLSVQRRSIDFAPATDDDIAGTEKQLGFPIPDILKSLYMRVGNGGFGPGRGGRIIGVSGGFEGSDGSLAEEYDGIKRGAEYLGLTWPEGLLPFCDWGCTICSCVHCIQEPGTVYMAESCRTGTRNCTLEDFVRMWIDGVDIMDYFSASAPPVKGINPFAREESTFTGRKLR